MLSEREKIEMIEDARDISRAEAFRHGRVIKDKDMSFDEYIDFLGANQKLFGPFPISRKPTQTLNYKL